MKLEKPPYRFWIAVMIFFATFTNYMMRANMTVSVGEMAKPIVSKSNKTSPCAKPASSSSHNRTGEGDFSWSQKQQGQLLAAYFYGTMISFGIGGTIAELWGAFNVIFQTSMLTMVLTAGTPVVAHVGGFTGTFAVRFVIGVLGGPVYPALNVIVAKWAPPVEKGKFVAAFMGNTIGVVITWVMVGNTTAQWGWEAGFYSVAALMGLFCLVFFFMATDTPQTNKCTSPEEVAYIEQQLGSTVSKTKAVPPYKQIFSSVRYWSTIVAQFGNLWALNLMLTFAPKYFRETLGFNLKGSTGYAALPYVARLICSQIFGSVGDWMRKTEKMSLFNIRRFFVIFSHFIPALCFCFIYFAGCTWQVVLTLMILNQGLNGAVVVGHMINCQDLAPNFAGTLYGIMNLIGSTTGFFVPIISAEIYSRYIDDQVLGASIIFMIGGVVLVATGAFFCIFGAAEIQPWNDIKPKEEVQTA